MDTLAFSHNWNQKLNADVFTTLRLRNDKRYFAGNRLNVILKGQPKGTAVILEVKNIRLEQINNYIAGLDTGLTAENCKQMIRQMYKNSSPPITWSTQHLSFILLAFEDRKQMNNLFESETPE
jgi:hypothetical protein